MGRVLSMLHVNWGGVAVGTIAAYLAGLAWYGLLFEERWASLSGAEVPQPYLVMPAGFIAVLIAVFGLDWVIRRTGSLGWFSGARVGLATAFFFGVSTTAGDLLLGFKPLDIIAIDVGYILLWFGVAGCMVGGLQRRARP